MNDDPPARRSRVPHLLSRVLTVLMYAYVIIPVVILMFVTWFTLAWAGAFD